MMSEREGGGTQTTWSESRGQKGLINQDLCSVEAAFFFFFSSSIFPIFQIPCANAYTGILLATQTPHMSGRVHLIPTSRVWRLIF